MHNLPPPTLCCCDPPPRWTSARQPQSWLYLPRLLARTQPGAADACLSRHAAYSPRALNARAEGGTGSHLLVHYCGVQANRSRDGKNMFGKTKETMTRFKIVSTRYHLFWVFLKVGLPVFWVIVLQPAEHTNILYFA